MWRVVILHKHAFFFLGDTNAIGSKYYVFNVWWELLFAIGGKISHTVSDLVHTYAFF